MEIQHSAVAGTLESSDCRVTVDKATTGTGIQLDLESSVFAQYGEHMKQLVMETLNRMEVQDAQIRIQDRGALDCTLRARVETAVLRASDIEGP